jgi:hypothetical protein
VLAVEQPQATVLNYAPGPLDTPMIAELLADTRTDPGMLRHFYFLLTRNVKGDSMKLLFSSVLVAKGIVNVSLFFLRRIVFQLRNQKARISIWQL